MKHLLSSNQFADVTLVCDDNVRIRAHSFVLSACSTVFSNLFNSESHETVFLKGIDQRDLKQILQFMYIGKATFSEDRVESFIAASKRLDVKEIRTRFEIQKEGETPCIFINKDLMKEEEISPEEYIISNTTPTHQIPSSKKDEETLRKYNQEMNKKEDSDSTNHVMKKEITPEEYIVTGSTKKVAISARSKVCPDCNKVFYDGLMTESLVLVVPNLYLSL